ncbi:MULTISPECIES: hypothetical protein [Pandoraea]|uniref:Type IV pilus biogenesis protein PilP n=1 Tax=Pandoraea capi TaxID=2508286 RepID=A0ABY6VVJ6_9BURK|nr:MULTISPECIES: hypothetical protein [Pandoraea]MCI3207331.1 hypothetical protein [Pandoraea sp. LA3]MDN4585360.1 hypothetical protein [Pandoraea capi]VVD91392.1 hypothetical protein PCA20602_01646 [Pandoraea capi]
MFIKFFRRAVLTMAAVIPATAHAEETIDAFARAHLKASQEAQDAKQADARAAAAGNAHGRADTKPPPTGEPPELLFIYGVENATVAYLRVDGRFGRNVTRGDNVGEWKVVDIGDDFVDLQHGAKRKRLLLPNAFGIAPSSATQASQRMPRASHGERF